MPADYNLQAALKSYLRRKYAADITGLRKEADRVFAEATETVTLTSLSAEGGSQAGAITCPKGLLLLILEELITELDVTAPRYSQAAVFLAR
jgi:hypothetical protein